MTKDNSYGFDQLTAVDISKLEEALGLTYHPTQGEVVFFDPESGAYRRRGIAVPQSEAIEILEAINRGAHKMEGHEGWIDPQAGFVEFELQQNGLNGFRATSIGQYSFEQYPCSHGHTATTPKEEGKDANFIRPVIRVTSADGSTCIEISQNTPPCTPIRPLDQDARGLTRPSLKVYLSGSMDEKELLRRSLDLANSFLFELNARHRASYSLRPKLASPLRRKLDQGFNRNVRFPRTPIPDSIATLFSIPGDYAMRGNHTISYLSYYQILEHYLPAVHKRESVKRVRRILRSLDFDEDKDSSVLKILNSVERSHGATEADQLKSLIEECVPEERLREFFSNDRDGHFAKNGPIGGIHAINLKSGETLASQVAKRVYMLRNRIVHAKDDAKYAESKVLLPLSHEALRLSPDIELVRLLAIEAIVDNR
ncbi:hypothetical protein ACFRAR_13360 [Kitasatospora sp. NPDC056651]|uniref:hypothetical protein n=1 Tax=Kitasatospora sp. NPDC056651 TaxID=3345892 RepID=UPI0036908B4D